MVYRNVDHFLYYGKTLKVISSLGVDEYNPETLIFEE